MLAYASHTGTLANLAALRAVNWRILVSRAGQWATAGFPWCADNGAWADHQAGRPFQDEQFERFLGAMPMHEADFIVLPDIVAGGRESLELSLRWMNRVRALSDLVLIAVQDGMEPADLAPYVGDHVGIFLGGSTEWKEGQMRLWGEACEAWGCWYHVARVNTGRRFRMAHRAGALSIDGTSATRFSKTVPALERWRSQPDLLAPSGGPRP